MKKLLIASLSVVLLLTACKKEEAPPPSDTKASEVAPSTQPATSEAPASSDSTATENHSHDHSHGHSHAGHDHGHAGDSYQCDNGKKIAVAIHDHEGEMEAHVTIDDIEYDLHPDTDKPNQYISKEEGINDKGMILTMDGNQASLHDLDNQPLLSCKKS